MRVRAMGWPAHRARALAAFAVAWAGCRHAVVVGPGFAVDSCAAAAAVALLPLLVLLQALIRKTLLGVGVDAAIVDQCVWIHPPLHGSACVGAAAAAAAASTAASASAAAAAAVAAAVAEAAAAVLLLLLFLLCLGGSSVFQLRKWLSRVPL